MVFEIVFDVSKKLLGCFISAFYVMIGISMCVGDSILHYIDSSQYYLLVRGQGKDLLKSIIDTIRKYLRMLFCVRRLDPINYEEEAIKRGNDYIDKLLKKMFDSKNGFDPYILEDCVVGFSKKVLFFNVTGEAKLYDSSIVGLSTLHREGYCTFQHMDRNVNIRAYLEAENLGFNHKGSVKIMNVGPAITVEGNLAFIEVQMELLIDRETGKNGRLTKFIIDDMRGMKVKVSGLSPLDWAIDLIVNGITKLFKRFVKNFTANKVEQHLRERILNYQFPVEDNGVGAPVTTPETEASETTPQENEAPKTATHETAPNETTPQETEAPETTPHKNVASREIDALFEPIAIQEPGTWHESEVPPQEPETRQESEVPPQEPETRQESEVPPQEPEARQESEVPPQEPEARQESEVPPQEPETRQESEVPPQEPEARQESEVPPQEPDSRQKSEVPPQEPEVPEESEHQQISRRQKKVKNHQKKIKK